MSVSERPRIGIRSALPDLGLLRRLLKSPTCRRHVDMCLHCYSKHALRIAFMAVELLFVSPLAERSTRMILGGDRRRRRRPSAATDCHNTNIVMIGIDVAIILSSPVSNIMLYLKVAANDVLMHALAASTCGLRLGEGKILHKRRGMNFHSRHMARTAGAGRSVDRQRRRRANHEPSHKPWSHRHR